MIITTSKLNTIEQKLSNPQLANVFFIDFNIQTYENLYNAGSSISYNFNQLKSQLDNGKMLILRMNMTSEFKKYYLIFESMYYLESDTCFYLKFHDYQSTGLVVFQASTMTENFHTFTSR